MPLSLNSIGYAIDWIVGVISPKAGLSRSIQRRAYEGASKRDGWRPKRPGASANMDHHVDASELRARARFLDQNLPYIYRGLNALTENAIGTGIIPRSLATNSKIVDDLWAKFSKQADADNRMDLNGLIKVINRTKDRDGEVLIRIRPRRSDDGLEIPVQLQVLEIDWLDSSRTQMSPNNPNNKIINGIEYDRIGRVVAYWLWDAHPGDPLLLNDRIRQSYPIPAESIIHFYSAERPGQGRGITRLASVIARARDLQTLEDAELQRKNLETRLSVMVSGDATQFALSESASISEVMQTGELGILASGSITQLPPGMSTTIIEPKAAPGFTEYVKYQLHLIASGIGCTYEQMTGDVSEVNFSSARIRLIEFRRMMEQEQWLLIIPKLMEKIWDVFIETAILAGRLPINQDRSVDWSTPKFDYVDPEKEVKADLAEIGGGLSSISEKLRRRGYKPDLVFDEIKQDFDRLKASGVLDTLLMMQAKAAPQPQVKEVVKEVVKEDQTRDLKIQRDQLTEQSRLIERKIERSTAELMQIFRSQQPSINVNPTVSVNTDHINRSFEEMVNQVREHLKDMPVVVNMPDQPAPVVNFNPIVKVEPSAAPTINVEVQPAPVTVEVHHPEETESTHVRDDKTGEIQKTVTKFKKQRGKNDN